MSRGLGDVYKRQVYEKSTSPLVDYYRGQGLLKSVNGDQARETVYGDVKEALGL